MILEQFNLAGLVALVTGASRGLGQAMAVGLAEAGADIVALDRLNSESTRDMIRGLGRKFLQINCDFLTATDADIAAVIDHCVSTMGRLDILVNNAGIIRRAPALEFSMTDWDEVMQVNLRVVFILSQAAAKRMAQQGGGKIINIASMLSFQGGITVPSYTAAKSGVAGLTRALANEWSSLNINVNAIAPGYIATDNTLPLRQDANRNKEILARIPAGRWGNPDDLKGVVVFLASNAASYIHGAILPVDGSWLNR